MDLPMRSRVSTAVYAASLFLSSGALGQGCQPFWVKPDPLDPAQYGINAKVFDDGSGSALYVTAYRRGAAVLPNGSKQGYARWDGHRWTLLSEGLPHLVDAQILNVIDDGSGPRLYGLARRGENAPLTYYQGWMWNGAAWEQAPEDFIHDDPFIWWWPITSFDDGTGLAVYGTYGGQPVRWDTASRTWTFLGQWVNDLFITAEVLDLGDGPALYFAGQFDGIQGVPGTRSIVKWRQGWHAIGGDLAAGAITDMEVYDDGHGKALYLAGDIGWIDHVPVSAGLIRHDKSGWSQVPGTDGVYLRGLCVFDDGTGPALYVAGDFTQIGGVAAERIARYDGTSWRALAAGLSGVTEQMVAFNDGRGPSLFVETVGPNAGGGYTGGGNLIQWVGCPNCYADADNNHRLNVNDFVHFIQRFAAQDPYANCDVNATIDINDFVCFAAKFAERCGR